MITTSRNQLASLLLRIGLAAVLVYASIASFVAPSDWIGYLPQFLTSRVSGQFLLPSFTVYEAVLALWLLSGVYVRYAAAVAATTFSGILLANLGVFAITFRDITMIFTSLALIFLKED